MTNKEKLRAAIKRSGLTMEETAKAIGMNPATLYRKLNTECGTFTIEEARVIGHMLGLNTEEMHDIFFTVQLA